MKVMQVLKLKVKILLPVLLVLLVATLTFGKVGSKRIITVVAEKVKETFVPRKEVNTKLQQSPQKVVRKEPSYKVAQSNGSLPGGGDVQVDIDNIQMIHLPDLCSGCGMSDWFPDSKRILVGRSHFLEILNIEDKSRITLPVSNLGPGADVSNDGMKIVFVKREVYLPEKDGKRNDVWFMNADGTGQRLIAENGEAPKFSHDGTKIVYSTYRSLFIINQDGGQQKQIYSTLEKGGVDGVSWSPDDKKITFVSYDGDFIVDVDTGHLIELPQGQWGPTSPSVWFHDGQWVLFGGLVRVSKDGNQITELDEGENPDISPDGKWIAYKSRWFCPDCPDAVPDTMVSIIDINGNNKKDIFGGRFVPDFPRWSPDGKKIITESMPY